MLIFSVHGDTNFKNHQLHHLGNGAIKGHLDNFAGVYCIMQAYFSGHLNKDYVRIEITYGEEIDFEGARNVRKEVSSCDMVVVIDVTGAETDKLFVVEKCRNENMRNFLHDIFSDMSCDIYSNCPDIVASQDESDIYCSVTPHCFFLGVNTSNGDYNEGQVESHTRYLDATRDAVIRLVERYPDYAARYGLDTAAADGPILMRTTTEEKCGCNGAGFYSNTVMQCDKCNKKITNDTRKLHCCPNQDLCKDCCKGEAVLLRHKKQCDCDGRGLYKKQVDCDMCCAKMLIKSRSVHICPEINICKKCMNER